MTETDHSYYIEAVVKALESDGLAVADWSAHEDEFREAYIELAPNTTGSSPVLAWHEEKGWMHGWTREEDHGGIQCLSDLLLVHGPNGHDRSYVGVVARPSVVAAALIVAARLDRLLDAEIPGDLDGALAAYLPEPAAEPTVVDLPLPKPEVIEP